MTLRPLRPLREASVVMDRCDELGKITDAPGQITRTFHSPAMQRANALVGNWMREAEMTVHEDDAFNLIGRLASKNPHAKTLLIGSHLDTVRDAGKYDGPLGVMIGIACVESLCAQGVELPFHLEVIGFSDEEGVRYQTTYLGSRAVAGTLRKNDLQTVEEKGIEKACRQRREILGYVEAHIEQGPVLEARNLPLGVVTAIAGQSRIRVELEGRAGHAGTTPMNLRRDALCAAAELVLAAETSGVIATVGQLQVEPGASNVIPARVILSLDVRHQNDARRAAACRTLKAKADQIARRRGVKSRWQIVQETESVACDAGMTRLLASALKQRAGEVLSLPSGAGHDTAAISTLCPVAMLFVRCKGGISHNPAESVKTADVAKAIAVLCDFILLLKASQPEQLATRKGVFVRTK